MAYLIIKALHVILMVSYFAGIFYLVRIFVYYKDTDAFEEPKKSVLRTQYVFMMKRLWRIIVVPGGSLMLLFGLTMITMNSGLLLTSWFQLKLAALVALAIYHYWCWRKVKQIETLSGGDLRSGNVALRQSNEIATFILFFVVFTVILKYTLIEHWWQLLLGFVGVILLIMTIVKLTNRNKK